MKPILLFAGTTEGRRLSECLSEAGISHTICVATQYGERVLKEHPLVQIHRGRMDQQAMREMILSGDFEAVVDATHPYASEVTKQLQKAMEGIPIPYYRLNREDSSEAASENVRYFEGNDDCAAALEQVEGNILLTTGSKELAHYCQSEELRKRLYVRVLPGLESISFCMEAGICGKQIIAMQGPFTEEMNAAILRQFQIAYMVTKISGMTGGFQAKLQAAEHAGIPVFVIGKPEKENGLTFAEVCRRLSIRYGKQILSQSKPEVFLCGIGMGRDETLTQAVRNAIRDADILLGAERMIAQYQPRIEKQPFYLAKQIIPYLSELQNHASWGQIRKIVILFSGDSGFYSGCQKLYEGLSCELQAGRLQANLRILPGVSSISYLASCIGESYQDAAIRSIHGKGSIHGKTDMNGAGSEYLAELVDTIRHHAKTFLLVSGPEDMRLLGELLQNQGLLDCQVLAGYQLSYEEQRLLTLNPEECSQITDPGLYTCMVRNPSPQIRALTHGAADAEFIRDRVPMTKEEVREVSICKLKLQEGAVVYDIGSGTGSIAVEIAGLSGTIQVYAIERKSDAVALIRKNCEKFHTPNVTVVEALAPEGLEPLPTPTHAFLGGTGGNMQEILSVLYAKNPSMRVVINAISMETIAELTAVLNALPMKEVQVVQIQISRSKTVGSYHLMQAENPVWICSFTFVPSHTEGEE